MKPSKLSVLFFLFLINSHHSNAQKEVWNLAFEAREPGMDAFVVTFKGDSAKGKVLKRRHSQLTGKDKLLLDGKEIEFIQDIAVLQGKDEYVKYIGQYIYDWGYTRIYRDTIMSLFFRDEEGYISNVSTAAQSPSIGGGHMMTSNRISRNVFYIFYKEIFRGVSLNSLKMIMKDCPAVLKAVSEEFDKDYGGKKQDKEIRGYKVTKD